MSERLTTTVDGKIAATIQYLQWAEENFDDPYRGFNRCGSDYIEIFKGLEQLFNYARTLPVNTILDVGAGLTRGVRDLQQSQLGAFLQFKATVLTKRYEIENYLGFDNTLITEVEKLDGIKDASCAVVLGANSIAYSVAPDRAISQIDRVLVPGGALKATFKNSEEAYVSDGQYEMDKHFLFSSALINRGYDCMTLPGESNKDYDVLLAIKPGGKHKINIVSLLLNDQNSYHFQIEEMGGFPPVTTEDTFQRYTRLLSLGTD